MDINTYGQYYYDNLVMENRSNYDISFIFINLIRGIFY